MVKIAMLSNENFRAPSLMEDILKECSNEFNKFIYVPSIELYVAKERTLFKKNQDECQEILHSNNQKMLTIPEFKEFLKYTKENYPNIYDNITKERIPWRSERLDADFKVQGKNLVVNYHIFKNGKIVRKSEVLDKNTLMENRTGISLENWINSDQTKQGLPFKNIKEGDLSYWHPRSNDNSATSFGTGFDGAGLFCNDYFSERYSRLGVRAVKQK